MSRYLDAEMKRINRLKEMQNQLNEGKKIIYDVQELINNIVI